MLVNVDVAFSACTVKAESTNDMHYQCARWLIRWLEFRLSLTNAHAAVVFDIDGTIIDENDVKNLHMYNVVKWCHSRQIGVFYVTARLDTGSNRAQTRHTLRNLDFTCDGLYMMPVETTVDSISICAFKRRSREHIARTHTLFATIGDMWWDVSILPTTELTHRLHSLPSTDCVIFFHPHLEGIASIKLPNT